MTVALGPRVAIFSSAANAPPLEATGSNCPSLRSEIQLSTFSTVVGVKNLNRRSKKVLGKCKQSSTAFYGTTNSSLQSVYDGRRR